MGMARLVLGLVRDAVVPGIQPDKRDRARRVLRRLAREHLRPEDLRQQRVRPVEGELFPSSWRDQGPAGTSGVAVVILSDRADADPLLAALRRGGIDPDVFVVHHESHSRSGAQVVAAPAEWGVAARLIALVNSGRLDPYQRLVVVSYDSSTIAGYACAALNALTEDPGHGLIVNATPVGPAASEYAQVRTLLQASDVRLSGAPWLWAPSLEIVGRAFLIQGLRSLRLAPQEFQQTHGADSERVLALLLGALATEAGCRVEKGTVEPASAIAAGPAVPRARIIPFYLPQFHPTPENDEWWGKGFTEWTNVTGAIPTYRGHQQPLLPADLGFYDLRLDAVRERQAELASAHGVEGFMYYHYWFAGRQILETPLESLVRNPAINQPFCLMWANENWTRSWDGGHHLLLLTQDYDVVPAGEFITHALAYMKDPRYLRVDGKAVLSVYRPQQIPDFAEVVAQWRERAAAEGIRLHILAVRNRWDGHDESTVLQDMDLDGSMDFPPHNFLYVAATDTVRWDPRFQGGLYSYQDGVAREEERLAAGIPDTHYPAVMTSWDNTARRQWKSDVWVGANPYTFRRWLAAAVAAVSARSPQHRIVFINAWNEWAEGAVLEPSVRFGRSYLHAIRDVVL